MATVAASRPAPPASSPVAEASPAAAPARRKLSYKDARELEQLPARIEALEADIAGRTGAMNDPAYYQQDPASLQRANEQLAALQQELELAYQRWAELDG